jgi:integrase
MLFSGLRRGECLALEWTDINLKDGYIDVNKSLEFGKNQSTIKNGGKTLSATRTVPIPPILVDYLAKYKKLLKEGGLLIFKTDNVGLFDFSLEEFAEFGLKIEWMTRDLHNSERAEGNVMTEYEKNFSEKGFTINSAIVRF